MQRGLGKAGQMVQSANARFVYHNVCFFMGLLLLAVSLFCGCGKEEVVFVAGEDGKEAVEDMGGSELLEQQEDAAMNDHDAEPEKEEAIRFLTVYVCGQVENPGVYELETESRIADAVECAGGMTESAAIDVINLAELLTDGQMIRIPSIEEAEAGVSTDINAKQDCSGSVSLNLATKEQLMTLPGIGEAKAEAILQYRREHGRFGSIEEIMNIPGIKEGVFARMKDRIRI